ncbi:hypothetical protein EDD36DRAFT_200348 [Exophiala viscosa]|uniref:Uncharacterized protein n=1 Tax=Exophiala viscosa TaxID=2486360 RepID=A0AAN6IDK9_9EURO|nr:hypothetical protein EDD36DRAFT_200348 [Exophiala viscosa]
MPDLKNLKEASREITLLSPARMRAHMRSGGLQRRLGHHGANTGAPLRRPHTVAIHEVDGQGINTDIRNMAMYPPSFLSGGNSRLPRSASVSQQNMSDRSASPNMTPAETPNLSGAPPTPAQTGRSDQVWASLGRVLGLSSLIGSESEEANDHYRTTSVSSLPSLPSPGLDVAPLPARVEGHSLAEETTSAPDERHC